MGGGKQRTQGSPLSLAIDGRALRSSLVQDRQDILHGVFEDHRSRCAIRHSGPAFVEHDQPAE
jgi:hypothetical protein